MEEIFCILVEDDYILVIVDVFIYEECNNKSYYMIIFMGIIVIDNVVIIICLEYLMLFDYFYRWCVKNFYIFMKICFVF